MPPPDPETPSGKTAADENFPVGSFLIARRYRPAVAAFYRFARAADDIADNPELTADEKIARLDLFRQGLDGNGGAEKARQAAAQCAGFAVPTTHAADLLRAFRQDAEKARYDSWDDLMGYCALSASPVGRFLLDLHGEDPALYRFSDPLCDALQVLNHLQDLKQDYLELDRIYLPADWMAAEGVAPDDLAANAVSDGLRRVIDRCLDRTDRLVTDAFRLPRNLQNRRLAMESAVIARLAARLAARLRHEDPLAGRVSPSRCDFLRCGVGGVLAGLFRR